MCLDFVRQTEAVTRGREQIRSLPMIPVRMLAERAGCCSRGKDEAPIDLRDAWALRRSRRESVCKNRPQYGLSEGLAMPRVAFGGVRGWARNLPGSLTRRRRVPA